LKKKSQLRPTHSEKKPSEWALWERAGPNLQDPWVRKEKKNPEKERREEIGNITGNRRPEAPLGEKAI